MKERREGNTEEETLKMKCHIVRDRSNTAEYKRLTWGKKAVNNTD